MNRFIWLGIIVWGMFVTACGLNVVGAGSAEALSYGADAQAESVIFLLAGGLITCLFGLIGMVDMMGWLPVLQRQ